MAATILQRPDCTLTLSVGERIEFALAAGGRYFVVGTPAAGIDVLVGYLEQTGVTGADEARLVAASRAAAERDGLERYAARSIGSELRRWCHQAGLSSDWTDGARRLRREHILAKVPQPATGREVTVTLGFRTSGDQDQVSFEEEYRRPGEVLGYSYGLTIGYDGLPTLIEYVETTYGIAPSPDEPDAPEDRLIRSFAELVARGTLNPVAGPGLLRELVETWCRAAGVEPSRRGFDRRETVIESPTHGDQLVRVSFSINAYSKQLGFEEGYGTAQSHWRDALYQLQFPYSSMDRLLPWLEARVGDPVDERLSDDDRLAACWHALARRGDLSPGRAMEVRDRVADWLSEAGVEFKRYGTARTAWSETLLSVHRADRGCIFTLTLVLDPEAGDKGITFTEFYDYGPRGDDPGREYGYSVHALYDALGVLADAYAPGTDGTPAERLAGAFKAMVQAGVLGDDMPLKANRQRVSQGFAAAGVSATTSSWSWFNSD
jgi:hypothetical protein